MYENYFNQVSQQTVYNQKIVAVHGYEGAKATQLTAGSSVMLPDDCEKIIWFISADQYGVKTVVGYPRLDPIDMNPAPQPQTQSQDSPIYVQQKEFDELKKSVDELVKELRG